MSGQTSRHRTAGKEIPMGPGLRLPRRLAVWALACGAFALTATSARSEKALFFGDVFSPDWGNGYIRSVHLDGTGLQVVADVGGGFRGIAIDNAAAKIYWTDVDNHQIRRADLDGGNFENLVTSGVGFPMGIAVDHDSDLLCWGDATQGALFTAHLDGTGVVSIVSTPFNGGLALDTLGQKVYWAAVTGPNGPEILRADYDGTNVETVVTGHDCPASIALDVAQGKVYWTDYVVDVVRRANLDGTGVEDLYVVGANQNPNGITLDPDAGKVYWGQDGETDRSVVMRMDLDGAGAEDMGIGTFGLIASLAMAEVSSPQAVGPLPVRMALEGSWPNPFSDHAGIRLSLGEGLPVRLAIYAIDGRRVTTLVNGPVPAGTHEIRWNGTDERERRVPDGVYRCRVEAGGWSRSLSIVLAR
jgi:hypothetical protein